MKNPANCPACDSPLNGGVCDLCRSLDKINAELSPIPVEQTAAEVWNWEKFFSIIGTNELEITPNWTLEQREARILQLQELDRMGDLIKQSARIRIQINEMEIESSGHKVRKLSPSKPAMFDSPESLKVSRIPKTKLEKAQSSINDLGIDFDALMLELKAKKV